MPLQNSADNLAYLITVSQKHILPTRMLLRTLLHKTKAKIYLVGNLLPEQQRELQGFAQVVYIDENDIDLSGRAPYVTWKSSYREWGYYKQMFLRLCCDRFLDVEHVVILDSEVFVFDNWDERRLFTDEGNPKCFYWISEQRKTDWDYAMYRGSALLFSPLPDFAGVMDYASSDRYERHISGVVMFSTSNLRHIWKTLEITTQLEHNMEYLFNTLIGGRKGLSFSEFEFYGIAVKYGLCKQVVDSTPVAELLGWYDNHDDVVFQEFARLDPMWSMCQGYMHYQGEAEYLAYMQNISVALQKQFALSEPLATTVGS